MEGEVSFVFPSVSVFRQRALQFSAVIILSWGERVGEM